MRRKALTIQYVILGAVLVAGGGLSCSRKAAPSGDAAAAKPAVSREFGKAGPVALKIELSADKLTTGDVLTCTLTVRANEGYEAEFPELAFPDDVPGMILTRHERQEKREQGQTLTVERFELEPEYAGKFEWPALEVYYHQADEIREEVLDTEPIAFEVTETPTSAEVLELKPARGLVTVEQIAAAQRRTWPWVVAGAAAAVVFAGIVVYLVRRPRVGPPPRPAHEVALEALRALAARDLVAQGLIEPFFVEITRIVRDYIEAKFGLRAPEQTTEEFLAGLASSSVVARHKDTLAPFLAAADEVKFARATPDTNVIQRTFDTARDFVLQTSGGEGGGA